MSYIALAALGYSAAACKAGRASDRGKEAAASAGRRNCPSSSAAPNTRKQMFGLGPATRVYLGVKAADMRKGFNWEPTGTFWNAGVITVAKPAERNWPMIVKAAMAAGGVPEGLSWRRRPKERERCRKIAERCIKKCIDLALPTPSKGQGSYYYLGGRSHVRFRGRCQ